MRIGLYFGSFNPIHNGHLIIANHVAEYGNVDKIWFVVSPQNPLKETKSLLNEYDRLHLVKLAIQDNERFHASDIEFKLPRPSYTIDTLTYLSEHFPQHQFKVIMGSDSFQNIGRWKNHDVLLRDYELILYKRPGFEVTGTNSNVTMLAAPLLEISSTYLRTQIRDKKSIRYLTPDIVADYIHENRYYL
ncbi:nicotinate (nicotinamide) nucleotide adenylyltransferase [Rurimicrobium arvi]|uniref:nicotinate (nicotinamide) nucleotide adenylyltransferase n=1 Tax=Rurimicrobium arvi TaxID=2049916 RepID=UPI0031CE018C